MRESARLTVLALVMAVGLGASCAWAQAPQLPGRGSVLSALTIAQGGGIRLLGMGGVCTAVADEGNIRNAASLVWVPRSTVEAGIVGMGTIDQGSGPEYTVRSYSLAQILSEQAAFEVRKTSLASNSYLNTLTGAVESVSYDAVLLAGGLRVGRRTSVGLTGALSSVHVDAAPYRTRGQGRGGVEAGVFQWLSDRLSAGAVYSYWDEVESNYWLLPVPPPPTFSPGGSYRTTIIKGGLAYRPDDKTVVAGEYARLAYENRDAGWEITDSRPYWGVERSLSEGLCVRAGSYGGAWTAGVGYRARNFRLDYAYAKDLNKESAEAMFPAVGPQPGSGTHYVSAVIGF